MLLAELPEEIRKLKNFRVNAEKDTNVVTRTVQRWRALGNPISNAIGDSEGSGFLIAALYADKLPLKVAEYIRQDVPFAALVPLYLLNEIDIRTGKNQIDEIVHDKRSRMKLVISTSLGQAWLINHPSCNLTTSHHSVFFTESPDDEALQNASNAVFQSWYTENLTLNSGDTLLCARELNSRDLCELVVGAIDRLMTWGINHEHDNFAQITLREMRARKRGKPLLPDDQSESQDGTANTPLDQSEINVESVEIEPPTLDQDETECQRILTHP
jgi:hypothetical protein